MPMFLESSGPRVSFSPLKSNIEDMVIACEELEGQLKYFVEDSDLYGLMTEDTFLENAPVRI
jgi:hypothetical protein